MIKRTIHQQITEALNLNKVILIWGARRVGKTTLVKSIIENLPDAKYFNCELLQNKEALETTNSELLAAFLGNYRYLVFDEAQNIFRQNFSFKVRYRSSLGCRQIACIANNKNVGFHF